MTDYSWIKFGIDLAEVPWHSWIQLGECVAKCEQIKQIPLKPHIREELHLIYLAKGIHATTAIEGNTLSEDQVQAAIEKRLELSPSKEYLAREVDNILEACNEIAAQVSDGEFKEISVEQICHYSRKVLQNDVPCDESAQPGQIRMHNVVVGNVYRAPQGRDVPELIVKFCEWMNSEDFENKRMPIQFAIIKAIAAHLYIAWIHPFGDGNGRVARLLEFAILLSSGVPSPAAHLLSNHYNITRAEYYRRLDQAGRGGEVARFFTYAIQGLVDGLNEQLEYIRQHVISVCWREYVYERFHEEKGGGDTIRRRRELALRISQSLEPVDRDTLLVLMSRTYKNRSPRTLSRDLGHLEKMELIVRDNDKYRSNKDLMLQFLPVSKLQ